jgi:hypothetical protein
MPKDDKPVDTKAKVNEAPKPDPSRLITDVLIANGYTVDIRTSPGVHDIVYHITVKR